MKLTTAFRIASGVIVSGMLAATALTTRSAGRGQCPQCGYAGDLHECNHCGWIACLSCWQARGKYTCSGCGQGNPQ